MNLNFHYINLVKRHERKLVFKKNWSAHGMPIRVDAIDMSDSKQGTLGCYLSHKKAFEQISSLIPAVIGIESSALNIICEDDAVPCSDLTDRLKLVMQQLPAEWDILMLGYSITKNSQYSKTTDLIGKAEKFIQAGHCYMVNPSFFETMQKLHSGKIFDNFDLMLRYLQLHNNVYMAIPAMAYQYSSFSDNSNRLVGNTHYTETLFKDKL